MMKPRYKCQIILPHTTFPAGVTRPSSLTFTWNHSKQENDPTHFDNDSYYENIVTKYVSKWKGFCVDTQPY